MSLLSTPTGRPDRVFSLISLVCALGGRVKSADAKEWLAPQYRCADGSSTTSKAGDRVQEIFRVARDLDLLYADKGYWVSVGELPTTRRELARHVHTKLCRLQVEDPDAVLLRAYAWCAASIEAQGVAALVSMSADDLARGIAEGLGRKSEGDDERSFNTTKLSAWKDWMAFLGLGWNSLPGLGGFLPDPSRRMEEDILTLFSSHQRVEAGALLTTVSRSFPYLDGGELFEAACNSVSARPPGGQLSRILSQALRSLEDNGIMRYVMEGDSKKGIQLHPDPINKRNAFSHVELVKEEHHV